MVKNKDLVLTPEYIKTRMQIDIYNAVKTHMNDTGNGANDIAKNTGLNVKTVKEAERCDFNGTLDEMVKLLVGVGAFPMLAFGVYTRKEN